MTGIVVVQSSTASSMSGFIGCVSVGGISIQNSYLNATINVYRLVGIVGNSSIITVTLANVSLIGCIIAWNGTLASGNAVGYSKSSAINI